MKVYDEDDWRTINGAKVKLDTSTGEIKAGMGGEVYRAKSQSTFQTQDPCRHDKKERLT